MKLTDKNYDIAGFELSRSSRLLIMLRLSAYGDKDLKVGYKDIIKLWLQHRFGNRVDRLKLRIARLINRFRR